MFPAGVTKVSPWEVVLLSPTSFGRRSQGLSHQPSLASSPQATALENPQRPQGMPHKTALPQMAAPGAVPQGGTGPSGSGAGPSQGCAGAVTGARPPVHAQEWQKESGGFTVNARSVPSATLCLCTHLAVWSCMKSRCMLCTHIESCVCGIVHDTLQYSFASCSGCVACTKVYK